MDLATVPPNISLQNGALDLILDRRLTAVRVGLENQRSNGTENWDTLQALD
jgi:hypothetical protein